jgi:Fe-S-cluster-containing dehydrogenase component
MSVNNEEQTQVVSRREFVTAMIGVGATLVVAATLADPFNSMVKTVLGNGDETEHAAASAPGKRRWGMVIDLSKCIGCEYCVYACQATNDTTNAMRWNVHIVDETPTGNIFHITRPCLHCTHAPCVSVCPVSATYNRDDGLVIMDYEKCIGCRYCEVACPYGARSFNWEARNDEPNPYAPEWGMPEVPRRPRGVIEKCTFCIHRLDPGVAQGLTPGVDPAATPACVNICPVTARYFGDLNDPESKVAQIIASTPTFRLREDLGTEPNVYYIPPQGLTI